MLAVLWVCIIISFLDSYGYGVWDLILSFRSLVPNHSFTKLPVRKINQIYLLVPSMNEVGSIVKSMRHLLKMVRYLQKRHPGVHCTCIYIDDASTDGTSQKLDQVASRHPDYFYVLHRYLPNAQKGKGMALNNALRWIDQQHRNPNRTIVGVIDSDSTPRPDLLTRVMKAFDYSHSDIIQTGILINNVQSFLTVMQLFEFSVPNFLTQVLRTRWGSSIASGNGQFMTLRMTDKVRWRGALLDDLEFSINGLLRDFNGIFLSRVLMPQEGVLSYRALVKQRTRWCQGGMQCLVKYGKRIIHSPYIQKKLKADMLFFMCSPFLAIILTPCSLISMILIFCYLWINPLDSLVALLVIFIVNCLITFIMIGVTTHVNGEPLSTVTGHHSIEMVLGNLVYLWFLAPVPFISLFRLIIGDNKWDKTAHAVKTAPRVNQTRRLRHSVIASTSLNSSRNSPYLENKLYDLCISIVLDSLDKPSSNLR